MAFLTGSDRIPSRYLQARESVASALAVIISRINHFHASHAIFHTRQHPGTSGTGGSPNRRPRAAARGRPDQPDFYLSGRHAHGRAARGVAVGGGDFCQQCFVCAVHRRPRVFDGHLHPRLASPGLGRPRGRPSRSATRTVSGPGRRGAHHAGQFRHSAFPRIFSPGSRNHQSCSALFPPHRGVDDSGHRRDGSEESRRRHEQTVDALLDHGGSGRIERAVQLALHLRKSRRASFGARRVRVGHFAGATGDARRHDLVVRTVGSGARLGADSIGSARRNGRRCAS